MTLRVSFYKLVKETLRRHLTALLITVLAFILHIVSFFLNVQNIINTRIVEDVVDSTYPPTRGLVYVKKRLTELSAPNMANAIIAMLIGVYLAFDFFRYMHSKKETDFYDSMPIQKQKWFLVLLICSFGIFLVPCAVATCAEIGIIYGVGYGTHTIVQNMLWNLLCMLGVFLASWATTSLAMVMTGHSIVAFLAVGVFVSYIPLIINYLVPTFAERFFDTYVYSNSSNSIPFYFSPVTLGYKLMYNYDLWNIAEHWSYLIGIFVFALLVGVSSYLLFLRRPSETAGRAMAFEKINFIIRFLLVIPLALYAGLFLSEMTSNESMGWLIFGIVFSAFLLHGIMECIFQFDIRALVAKKGQLLLSIVLCLGFVTIFWADIFGYDEYLPDVKDVEYIEIDAYIHGFSTRDLELENDWLTGEYIETALTAAQEIMNNKDSYDETITFTYHLKNGIEKSRQYYFKSSEVPKSLDMLTATEEFKNDFCGLYNIAPETIVSISYANGMNEHLLLLTKEEIKELRDIYLEELTPMTYSELTNQTSDYQLLFKYQTNVDTVYNMTERYNVYSNCSKTIAFIKERGAQSFKDIKDLEFLNLEIHDGAYEGERYVNDADSLNALKEHMILEEFMGYKYNYDEYVYCTLSTKIDGGIHYIGVYLKQSELDAVLEK